MMMMMNNQHHHHTTTTTPTKRIQKIPLFDLELDTRFQPRSLDAVPKRLQNKVTQDRENNVIYLVGRLDIEGRLDPITVGEVDGVLYVLDGWHRYAAYSCRGKQWIPARVIYGLTEGQAVQIASLSNQTRRALRMERDQHAEASWCWLVIEYKEGKIHCNHLGKYHHQEYSLRQIQGITGTPFTTIARMLGKLGIAEKMAEREGWKVNPSTGFPFWKFARLPGDDGELSGEKEKKKNNHHHHHHNQRMEWLRTGLNRLCDGDYGVLVMTLKECLETLKDEIEGEEADRVEWLPEGLDSSLLSEDF